jgi:signal transduction histidine kinase
LIRLQAAKVLRIMSAIAQFRTEYEESADRLILAAAMEACSTSQAVIEGGRVIYANRAFAQMFGYAQTSEVRGRSVAEFFSEAGMATRRDGSRIHIQTSSASFRVKGVDFGVISIDDVTQQKRSEQQLQESQKMEAVGRLLGGVAHDFNNLITGIMLYCDLLIAGLGSDRRLRHHAQEIRMAGEQSAALIQQLLAVARPREVEPRVLSVNEVVCGMQDLLARLIGENIELITALAGDLGWVKMDPAQVQQIVMNLVLNARDAMPDGGRVTVKTRNCAGFPVHPDDEKSTPTPCIEFTVIDTGCGMNAETRSHLFEPFFTTKRPGQGNGLGLATAFGIVKQAGGTIVVESEPGRGTQVSVRLPRVEPEPARKSEPQKPELTKSELTRGDAA